MKKVLLMLILSVLMDSLMAQPPLPPLGYRWILNEALSDEFNGDELDMTKWYNYHPSWKGREPAMFHTDMVSVQDGMMQIRNQKLDHDSVIYNSWNDTYSTYSIAGGAVVSKQASAFYGYYECRMKANKTLMSSTFWLSSGGSDGPATCDDRYSLELDIQECVGRAHSAGSHFHIGMHSNTHYWYTDCEGTSHDYKQGSQFDSDIEVSDDFHVYGAHWIDAKQATFFLNDDQERTISFPSDASETPFDKPMSINMVTETYDWVGVPTDEELADDSKNTTYYDWIRSYKLLGIDEVEEPDTDIVKNGGFETGDFTYWTGWGGSPKEVVSTQVHSGSYAVHIVGGGAPEYVVSLKPNTEYTLSCYAKVISGTINFGIKENGGSDEAIATKIISANTGFELEELTFTTNASSSYKFYFYAPSSGDEGYADDFAMEETNPTIVPDTNTSVFTEGMELVDHDDSFNNSSSISAILSYKLNTDGMLTASLIDESSTLVDTFHLAMLTGFGQDAYQFTFDSLPVPEKTYTVQLDLYDEEEALVATTSFSTDASSTDVENKTSGLAHLVVYPNPSAEIIYVKNLSFNEAFELKSMSGQTVLKGVLNARQAIDLTSLDPGYYILHVRDVGSVKVIKH